MSDVVAEVQAILGYTFKKTELLVRALTHNSGVGKGLRQSYQNLEFLGDSILNFVIAEELLRRHPEFNEGQLTRMRSAVVSEKPLAETIYKLGLSDFLIMGVSETKMHINQNSSVMEDMFEAIVGAVYLDGGMSFAKKFILTTLEPILLRSETDKNDFYDYKSMLNEYASKFNLTVKYVDVVDDTLPEPIVKFIFDLSIDGDIVSRGVGNSKKEAQQMAAKIALNSLKEKK
ncbi:MAG: ribonuclease III [Clostridia bacterium]